MLKSNLISVYGSEYNESLIKMHPITHTHVQRLKQFIVELKNKASTTHVTSNKKKKYFEKVIVFLENKESSGITLTRLRKILDAVLGIAFLVRWKEVRVKLMGVTEKNMHQIKTALGLMEILNSQKKYSFEDLPGMSLDSYSDDIWQKKTPYIDLCKRLLPIGYTYKDLYTKSCHIACYAAIIAAIQ